MRKWQIPVGLLAAGVTVVSLNVTSGASAPTPGTATQILALVAAAKNITTLPSATAAALPSAAGDFSFSNYPVLNTVSPSTCLTATACVYGDTGSTKTVVMFGDSHALMWLPAVVPVAQAHHERVVLLWQGACPPGNVSVYLPQFHYPAICNAFRSSAISIIKALKPISVLLVGASSEVQSAAGKFFTDAQWKAGLISTIKKLATTTTKIAVIEDNVTFNLFMPACLDSYPSSVQSCSVQFPNPTHRGLQKGEKDAATATKSLYVKTQQWLCTTVCSSVIGTFIPYIDNNHISFTYARYLSTVMGNELKPLV